MTRYGQYCPIARAAELLGDRWTGLGEWAARFGIEDPRPDELDPTLLMWWVRRGVDRTKMPARRTVIEFRFRGQAEHYWLVVEPDDVSVCYSDPGFEVDLLVRSDVQTMYRIWLGREELLDAIRHERVQVDGSRQLVRHFPGWLELRPLAPAVRAAV